MGIEVHGGVHGLGEGDGEATAEVVCSEPPFPHGDMEESDHDGEREGCSTCEEYCELCSTDDATDSSGYESDDPLGVVEGDDEDPDGDHPSSSERSSPRGGSGVNCVVLSSAGFGLHADDFVGYTWAVRHNITREAMSDLLQQRNWSLLNRTPYRLASFV